MTSPKSGAPSSEIRPSHSSRGRGRLVEVEVSLEVVVEVDYYYNSSKTWLPW